MSSKKLAAKTRVKSAARKQQVAKKASAPRAVAKKAIAKKAATLTSKSAKKSPAKKASTSTVRKSGAKKASSNPQWQQYEKLITKIYQQLAPTAEVAHNRRIMGVSGRRRQIDVLISQDISNFPIRVVLECKRYTRPVTIDKVEAFAQKLQDMKAN